MNKLIPELETPNIVETPKEEVVVETGLTTKYITTVMNSMGIASSLDNNEKIQFIAVCQAMQLNPIKREVYAIKYSGKFNIVVGYQVYIERAYKTGLVDYYETELIIPEGAEDKPMLWSSKFIIKRKDSSKEMSFTIWLKEFTTGQSTWLTKPKFMLEKCAIANGMRRAFPIELGDMPYTSEELWYHTKDSDNIVSENIKLEGIKK